MNSFQIALLIGATITALISSHLPRAWLWIGCGAVSFIASTAYARYGLPYPPAFTLACDAAVCLAIYGLAKEKWELLAYDVFRLSVLISLLHLFGAIESHWLYVVALELCNWLALLVIGGTAILAGVAGENSTFGPWLVRLRGAQLSLRKARPARPWYEVAR